MSEPLGKPRHITLHWSAGSYTQTHPGYHASVVGSGEVLVSYPYHLKGSHTWGRNSGNLGGSLCADPTRNDRKPKDVQIEALAKWAAEACIVYGLNPRGTVTLPAMRVTGRRIVAVPGKTIEAPVIADHAFFAKKDGYFPDRWDIGDLYPIVLNKARWYFDKLQAGALRFEHFKR